MTVAELIEELKKYPQDLQVAVPVADPSWGQPEIFRLWEITETTILAEDYKTRLDVLALGWELNG